MVASAEALKKHRHQWNLAMADIIMPGYFLALVYIG